MRVGFHAALAMVAAIATPVAGEKPFSFPLGPADDVADGRKLFNPTCSNGYCHGANGNGGGGPALKGRALTPEGVSRAIVDGVPGSSMRGFRDDYSPQQLRQLIAYVMSMSKPAGKGAPAATPAKAAQKAQPATAKTPSASPSPAPAPPAPAPAPPASSAISPVAAVSSPAADLKGSVQAGQSLFFDAGDSRSCRACHSFNGIGGNLGPDLAKAAKRAPREWLEAIANPAGAVDSSYTLITVRLRNGEAVTGVKREEDAETIRIADATALPFVTRSFLKSEIAQVEKTGGTPMPGDYARRYSQKQILDLISFLAQSPADGKDVF